MPDAHERIGPQHRDDLAAQRAIKRRVTEHGRDRHRERRDEARHAVRLTQDPRLERRDRRDRFLLDDAADAPPQRRGRIIAEIVTVAMQDAVQQQLDLEILDVAARVQGRPGLLPVGVLYLYSHTRSREMSWSVSTGFVM